MPSYYVNKEEQPSGEHEVHYYTCCFLPSVESRRYLGEYDNCEDAVKKAKEHYDNVEGCYYCAYECHSE